MEWYISLLLLMGTFFTLILMGIPVVFAFFGVNIIFGAYFMGTAGFELLIDGVYGSLSVFVLLPITLFILMGEVLFRTGIAMKMINTLDSWMGAIPGRLSLLSVGSGTLMATLSGASIGTTAMLVRTLTPAMEARGYSKNLAIGPLLGSGGLAIMIPPSALGVILAVVASVSVGKLLIAIIIPGILLALSYVVYIFVACWLDPNAAPAYDEAPVPMRERLVNTAIYILPLSIIVFLVIGVVFLGVATPTEAAALGTAGSFVLAACYRQLSWAVTIDALMSTLRISIMVLAIMAASTAFTQILAYSGASQQLVTWAASLPIPPIWVIVMMHLITLILGGPIGGIPLIMMTIPVFIPVVVALGYDPIWFCVAMLVNVELAQITPPFGVLLYVTRGILKDTSMAVIARAAVPIIVCNLIVMGLLVAFPALSMWLPSLMME
ncbi:TRAP transporter large permease subunit [Paracoccus sp. S-4012]|uniref:TRAP transporter large permease n=1 Tax=Paracoccus sp. S-4012 TaxID=2665648 RepID=UPI0012B0BAED|nr:TRAP transporter large permease subunit [Paracoccus sp. S-4012]MRX52012.1 TRAP transporter large permease subunit [Paracoccus sp. S-4012]